MNLISITTRLIVIRFLPFPFTCSRVKSCGKEEWHFSVIRIMMIIARSKIFGMIGDVRGSSAKGGPLQVDPKPSHTQVAVIAMVSLQRKRHSASPKPETLRARTHTHTHRQTDTHAQYQPPSKHFSLYSPADRQKLNAHALLQPTWRVCVHLCKRASAFQFLFSFVRVLIESARVVCPSTQAKKPPQDLSPHLRKQRPQARRNNPLRKGATEAI